MAQTRAHEKEIAASLDRREAALRTTQTDALRYRRRLLEQKATVDTLLQRYAE